jgi:CheY-like chemotaxis protein
MDEPPKAVDVVKALDAATRLAMHHIGERARLVSSLSPVQRVLGNDGQLAQVFLNLLVNAAQAIPRDSPGMQTVGVKTSMEGGDVVVEISDTGVGMEPEVARHAFDAFFTTKPAGEGTGLGLSISKDIVDSFGGSISVESAPGRGATFRVRLPGWAEADQPKPEPVTAKPLGGARKVLVIDDEPALGALLRAVLRGDDVEAFSDPRAALRRLAAGGPIDVVICDFQMPGMDGMEVYAEIRQLRPDCASRFVLMTGAVGDYRLDEFLRTHSIDLLSKPFRAAELTACLTRLGLR